MKPGDWEMVYGESVRIINNQIIAAFRPDQIKAATEKAEALAHVPMIVGRGILA
jgi:hypothetical protein